MAEQSQSLQKRITYTEQMQSTNLTKTVIEGVIAEYEGNEIDYAYILFHWGRNQKCWLHTVIQNWSEYVIITEEEFYESIMKATDTFTSTIKHTWSNTPQRTSYSLKSYRTHWKTLLIVLPTLWTRLKKKRMQWLRRWWNL
jgi:hypothetical protein